MIREFEIYNEKFKEVQAYLYYDTETKKFNMQLLKDYTGLHPDIIFLELYKQGIVDVPQHIAQMWAEGRVFPPNRQGLQGMLEDIGMTEYDVFEIMLYGNGRCQMDYSCIREITNIVE